MPSSFNVGSAEGYDQIMGRWSRRLAPMLIDFAGIGDGESILDVGCGTGSLTFTLAKHAGLKAIAAIDYSDVFVEAAIRANSDPRITIRQADACALPFADGEFDRALSLLVLHFVPEAGKAVAEMARVVRPGGVVAAAVWDHYGGMSGMRLLLDTAAMIDPKARAVRHRYAFQPMMRLGELRSTFVGNGLVGVEDISLTIRMDYSSFDDYWSPIAAGEGPLGKYVAGLDGGLRERLAAAVRDAYEAGEVDGPRSFASVAWACRGRVAG